MNQGYYIIDDNLYTSPELARTLFDNVTDIYGTLRKKKGLPQNFWQWKLQEEVGIEPMMKFCDEKLVVFRWNDPNQIKSTKIVSMLSSIHVGKLVDTGKVDFDAKQNTVKPDATVDYNENMGGVDLGIRVIIPIFNKRVVTNGGEKLLNYL